MSNNKISMSNNKIKLILLLKVINILSFNK